MKRGVSLPLRKGGDFYLAVVQTCFVHHLFQLAGRCVINPFFATLRADGGTHAPHHHDSAPQVCGEGGRAFRLVSSAEWAGVIDQVHGFRLVR